MAVLTILSVILVRNLKVEKPGKIQLALESFIGFLNDFFLDTIGKDGKPYIPYLISVALYIGAANLIGLFGFKPPTKDLNVTAALALMSLVLIYYSGLRKKAQRNSCWDLQSLCPLSHPLILWRLRSVPFPCACGFSET